MNMLVPSFISAYILLLRTAESLANCRSSRLNSTSSDFKNGTRPLKIIVFPSILYLTFPPTAFPSKYSLFDEDITLTQLTLGFFLNKSIICFADSSFGFGSTYFAFLG
jgi:hypothetical protein